MNPPEERIDLYSGRAEPLGVTKPRHRVHRDGDWHKTFHCWIIYTGAAGQDRMVFQQRGRHVERWPAKLDITAAGHYRAGESLKDGGLRELREELGLSVNADQLVPAGMRISVDEFQPGVRDYEFQEVYFLNDDRALDTYQLQAAEVGGLAAVPIVHLLPLLAHETDALVAPGVLVESGEARSPTVTPHEFVVHRADFIPSLDRYYHRAAILAQRILRGEPYIWI